MCSLRKFKLSYKTNNISQNKTRIFQFKKHLWLVIAVNLIRTSFYKNLFRYKTSCFKKTSVARMETLSRLFCGPEKTNIQKN